MVLIVHLGHLNPIEITLLDPVVISVGQFLKFQRDGFSRSIDRSRGDGWIFCRVQSSSRLMTLDCSLLAVQTPGQFRAGPNIYFILYSACCTGYRVQNSAPQYALYIVDCTLHTTQC